MTTTNSVTPAILENKLPQKPQKQIKESQAKNNVGAMNRSQQAYLLENPEFANTIEDLQLGLDYQCRSSEFSLWPKPKI